MRLNPAADVHIQTVGDLPILVIDNVYEDIDAVRAQALAANYSVAAAFYPGLHAPLSDEPTKAVVAQLCGLMTKLGQSDYDPDRVMVDFSVITTPPDKLLAEQQHPHTDPVPVFAIAYLTPGIETSTCFYRNRVTGRHTLVSDEDRQAHDVFIKAHGSERDEGAYDLSNNPYWERMLRLEGRYNRLVCYPGSVFHSVEPGPVPQPFDINSARITQRFAFAGVTPRQRQAQ